MSLCSVDDHVQDDQSQMRLSRSRNVNCVGSPSLSRSSSGASLRSTSPGPPYTAQTMPDLPAKSQLSPVRLHPNTKVSENSSTGRVQSEYATASEANLPNWSQHLDVTSSEFLPRGDCRRASDPGPGIISMTMPELPQVASRPRRKSADAGTARKPRRSGTLKILDGTFWSAERRKLAQLRERFNLITHKSDVVRFDKADEFTSEEISARQDTHNIDGYHKASSSQPGYRKTSSSQPGISSPPLDHGSPSAPNEDPAGKWSQKVERPKEEAELHTASESDEDVDDVLRSMLAKRAWSGEHVRFT